MAEPSELAQKARKTLADGLQALQAGDDVPDELLDIAAEPIAKSMGLLHKIEKAGANDAALANEALTTVRATLDTLQSVTGQHPAVDAAMEAVAGSLSKLFALTKALEIVPQKKPSVPPPVPKKGSRPPSSKKPSRPPPPPKSKKPFGGVNQTVRMADNAAIKEQVQAAAAADVPTGNVPPGGAGQAAPATNTVALPGAGAPAAAAPAAAPAAAAPAAAAPAAAAPAAAVPAAPASQKERVPGQTDAPVPVGGATEVSVELGAHSPSNFYKGLSGNDVIDHGGIFVATYQIPKIGDAIALKMLLPGDLEFFADCVVQWIRETQSGEAEPGFGARFTRISPEGRQLIYRYVRNREPMFYDDL